MSNIPAEIKFQGNSSAWFTTNALEIYPANILIFHVDGRYKFTDGVTTLNDLPFLGGSSPQSLADTLTIGRKTGEFSIESDNGFSYLYAINVKAGHEFNDETIVGKMISDVNQNEIKHTVLNKFDAPDNNFPQENANEVTYFDASHNLKGAGFSPAQVALKSYVDGVVAGLLDDRGITRVINTITTTTTALGVSNTDYVYLCDGTFTLTLPTAVGNNSKYTIKNIGTGTITVNTTSSQTIDGSTLITIPVRYTSLDLISDNSNFNII